jgi:methionyl aminopeptidase
MSKVGVNLMEIEQAVEDVIKSLGGQSSFKTVPGYRWTTCLTDNNEVVHGIPRDYVLREGDILSIDLGAVFEGWHSDCAWSVLIRGKGEGESRQRRASPGAGVKGDIEKERFLKIGEEAMWAGVKQAVAGRQIGDIGSAMQNVVEAKGGYKVVRTLVGHGIGRALHEDPEVPGFGRAGVGIKLQSDETLAIESIYTESSYDVKLAADNWTYVSSDGSLAGMFEMTVIVGEKQPEVLTDWRKVSG